MTEFREPKSGDVIWADRMCKGLPYNHCGIYEGGGYVIHYAAPEGSEISQENAVIHRVKLEDFKDGCPLKIVEFPQGYSADETLRRARSRIGEKDYNLALNNCDHFATWCKTGEHRSIQVEDAKKAIVALGGPVGKIICTIHDIAEDYKAASLDSIDMVQKPKEISKKLDLNSDINASLPPVLDAEPEVHDQRNTQQEKNEFFEKEPDGIIVKEADADVLPPEKKAWYEKVGDKLKDLTYPISGGLELLKRLGKLPPPLNKVDYITLGGKVRNTIDNIVTTIKVFTGKLPLAKAREEISDNETALLGQIIVTVPKVPIRQAVKQTFGRIGSAVKHFAQQTVARIVPQPVRTAIKTGFQKVGHAVVSGLKAIFGGGGKNPSTNRNSRTTHAGRR